MQDAPWETRTSTTSMALCTVKRITWWELRSCCVIRVKQTHTGALEDWFSALCFNHSFRDSRLLLRSAACVATSSWSRWELRGPMCSQLFHRPWATLFISHVSKNYFKQTPHPPRNEETQWRLLVGSFSGSHSRFQRNVCLGVSINKEIRLCSDYLKTFYHIWAT